MCEKHYKLEAHHLRRLSDLCCAHGFTQRGRAFFRINGDGILQVIKMEYERVFSHYCLNFLMVSMYGELYDDFFSAVHCPLDRTICNLIDQTTAVKIHTDENKVMHIYITSIDEQLDILEAKGLPMMKAINTQGKLANALCSLDQAGGASLEWNDFHKIAPFLADNDYQNAEKVVCSILRQHISVWCAREGRQIHIKELPWTEDDFLSYMPLFREEDQPFLRIHRWITNNDLEAIQNYLKANYARNMQQAKFCAKESEGQGNDLRES